jgi:hypothetical protein
MAFAARWQIVIRGLSRVSWAITWLFRQHASRMRLLWAGKRSQCSSS